MTASSSGERSSRCRFSMRAISRAVESSKRSTIAGIVSLPASFDARQRRSPAMISYSLPAGRTRIGWSTPCSRIDAASSASVSSCQVVRGCEGLATTFSSGSSRTAVGVRAARRLMMPLSTSLSCWKMRLPASRKLLPWRGLLVSTDYLLRKVDKALGRVGARLVDGDRDAGSGGLADLHRLSDHGVEDLVVAEVLERIGHVASENRPAVIKGREQTQYLESGVEARLNGLDDLEERRHALERVVLRLHGDDHPVRGDEGVQREEPERRRAIDQHVVIAVDDLASELVAEGHLAPDGIEKLDLGCRELQRTRRDVDVLGLRRVDDRVQGHVRIDEDLGDRSFDRVEIEAQPHGEICLRIEINAENFEIQ